MRQLSVLNLCQLKLAVDDYYQVLKFTVQIPLFSFRVAETAMQSAHQDPFRMPVHNTWHAYLQTGSPLQNCLSDIRTVTISVLAPSSARH